MRSATTGTARIAIAAPPEKVWALIADVTRMGEWSPETYRAEWIDGATGPTVGARFRGSNHLGPIKWHTQCVIRVADPRREFAFTVVHSSGRESTNWRYLFTPTATGTEVVESYQFLWCPVRDRIFETFIPRDKQLRAGIAATLDRLKIVAESA